MHNKELDHYYFKAKQDGNVARSIYKLEEIDKKFSIIKPNMNILDLGAAPGSWLQYVIRKSNPKKSKILAIDLNPLAIAVPDNVTFIENDIHLVLWEDIKRDFGGFDCVLSDMAPQTTGIKLRDHVLSMELCDMALNVVKQTINLGGHFCCKYFQGSDEQLFVKKVKENFKQVKIFKPESSNKKSKERFVVALNYIK